MRIGQDVNMDTNIAEGYGILSYRKSDLYVKGKFNPNGEARFIRHFPDYCIAEAKDAGQELPKFLTNAAVSAQDVFEQYQKHANSIDSFCGTEPRTVPSDEYELLNLASDIDQYCGLC